MTTRRAKRIPVNLIAGPLGAGKTTVINHLLESRPPDEKWAVLVNEYGLVGLDAALIGDDRQAPGPDSGRVEIREVAGGCICCTAGFVFEAYLVLLLQGRPDRLLIEPTGLAALSGILDTLARPGIRESVDVRSVVCLLDPSTLERDLEREEVRDQYEAADVLLASRSDLASEAQLGAFEGWARGLFPPKPFIGRVEQGRLPLELLDRVQGRGASQSPGNVVAGHPPRDHDHSHDHDHDHDHDHHHHAPEPEPTCDADTPIIQRSHRSPLASTLGWICWEGLVFDAERVHRWLLDLSKQPGTRRTKAVLRTTRGWRGFNCAGEVEEVRATGHRRDSRLELVIESDTPPDPAELEAGLRACLISSPARA